MSEGGEVKFSVGALHLLQYLSKALLNVVDARTCLDSLVHCSDEDVVDSGVTGPLAAHAEPRVEEAVPFLFEVPESGDQSLSVMERKSFGQFAGFPSKFISSIPQFRSSRVVVCGEREEFIVDRSQFVSNLVECLFHVMNLVVCLAICGAARPDDTHGALACPFVSPYRSSAEFTQDWKHFDFSVEDSVGVITFNRPDRLNALTFDVYADLRDLLAEVEHRDDVSVLMITGEGRGFCSGGDVHEIIGKLLEMDSRGLLDFTRMTGAVVEAMRRLPMPVIAAVNGVAAGAGAVIALASDLRILSESASFHFLFTKVGLAGADMGSAYLLPRVVGLGRASELLLLGEPVDSATAINIGLATRVVADADLLTSATEMASGLAGGPSLAYGATKVLLSRELDMDLGSAIELEAYTQALLMTTEDHAEFYRAFTAKRDPEWKGR